MEKENKNKALVSKIIAFESGEMDDEEIITFFQDLINTGLCWNLQGHYGRTATALIKQGYCEEKTISG